MERRTVKLVGEVDTNGRSICFSSHSQVASCATFPAGREPIVTKECFSGAFEQDNAMTFLSSRKVVPNCKCFFRFPPVIVAHTEHERKIGGVGRRRRRTLAHSEVVPCLSRLGWMRRLSTVASHVASRSMTHTTPEAIRSLLQRKVVAVVGMSTDTTKPSYHVAHEMQQHGYQIVPVRPGLGVLLGEPIKNRLTDIPERLMQHDVVVDVFRRPEDVESVVDEAIAAKATGIWFQLGVVNEKAIQKALAAGMTVVADRCLWIEYQNQQTPP